MNFNDSEIVLGILHSAGYHRVHQRDEASIAMLMTCAIREGAESKIWQRIDELASLRRKNRPLTIAVLGCMAERLKEKLLEKGKVNLVCGPDAYKDLPRLLDNLSLSNGCSINTQLSLEETYADVAGVRLNPQAKSAFVSIMRGCNNMCAFCIVPFVRGRERSKPLAAVMREIERLHQEEGVLEVVLLGQNVNSYQGDISGLEETVPPARTANSQRFAPGFTSIFRRELQPNTATFAQLLDVLSAKFPNIRFKFTSPHPKDFPLELLQLISERQNICNHIHLPAQSGSSSVLERMRRGYDRSAYLQLVETIHKTIPQVTLSSDFIVGFCGESAEEHKDSLDLIKEVPFDMAFMFSYSMREKTHAHRTLEDSVPEQVKSERLREMQDLFYSLQVKRTQEKYLGSLVSVLVEGPSKKNPNQWMGMSENNRPVVFEASGDPSGTIVSLRVIGSKGGTLIGQIE